MEIGEEQLAAAQHAAFLGLRLLDLDDHVGLGEDLGSAGDDARPGGAIGLVVEADAEPGAALDQHLVAVMDQLMHARRHQPDPVLVRLDLPGNADQHG